VTGFDAILLVSFGGPEGPDDVAPFLEIVTAGRAIPRERLDEVAAHYHHFNGISPINDQCRRIRAALAEALASASHDLPVYWGNRNWHPFLADTVAQMAADGIGQALAIVTSAYSSHSGCRQYLDDIHRARAEVGATAPLIEKVRAYHDHPEFIAGFISATRAAQHELGDAAATAPLVFTAHSLPVADAATCDYEAQLIETAGLVVDGLPGDVAWSLAWQSRSGPPTVPWLAPDINDELRRLASEGAKAAVMVPIGFVSDHMEVVWDLDIEAMVTAGHLGIRAVRAATPGTEPSNGLITMYVDLIEERLTGRSVRASIGQLGVRPDKCPSGCCPPLSSSR